MEEYKNLISFIKEVERLKNVTRTAWTSEGRQESVAEHSWRLSLFAMVLEDYFKDIDFNKVLRMSLVHDLGEAYDGDISAKVVVDVQEKLKKEEQGIMKLTEALPKVLQQELIMLWQEYNSGKTNEAKLVKAIDKIETIIQHNQGDNPADFDYHFNLEYGKKLSDFHPIIQTIRELVDKETIHKIDEKNVLKSDFNNNKIDSNNLQHNQHLLLSIISDIGIDETMKMISRFYPEQFKKEMISNEIQELQNRVTSIEGWIKDQNQLGKSPMNLYEIRGESGFKEFELWNQVLAKIQQNISKPSFDTWFAGTSAKYIDEDTIMVYSKNEFQSEWLKDRYKEEIFFAVKEVAGLTYDLEFSVSKNNLKK
ncbi:HD domain-containing protein [Neobacillus massiliamazoniensis]|nr:HD domain-containing protein [Neobacillus massiliamazoniensis]